MLYEKESPSSLGLPVFILSIVVVGFLALQTWMLSADRAIYTEAYAKQDEVLANIGKAKGQANNLVKGVMNLAKQNNRNAENIINELKKAGINFQDVPAGAATPAPDTPSSDPAAAPKPSPAPAPQKK
ncbi:MAG: hypothetical protein PHW76_07035 [Alphaproteobacteria bacterium]|nr:hypothetical protein [Alphaproteobacteria bacterium]